MDPEKNTSAPEEQFDNKTPQNETVVETTQITDAIDYQTLSIPELLAEFERLIEAEDKTNKNADIIKSCFYKAAQKRPTGNSSGPGSSRTGTGRS